MRGDEDTVKILLEAKADPNVFSSDGYTPRWSAVDFSLTEIEELLTSFGAKVLTDKNFDRTSWSIFKGALVQPMPEEENNSIKTFIAKFIQAIQRFVRKQ